MRLAASRTIEVWIDSAGIGQPALLGILSASPARGKEVFSFAYDPLWLKSHNARSLDPSLVLFSGPQFAAAGKTNFGMFLDSSPDRWGRRLMDRREAQAGREEDHPRRQLHESDYLLGVHDGQRMGALRFRLEPGGPFLDDTVRFASPPWTSLCELEQASLALEAPDAENDRNYGKWLRMLIAPGGSLGGARPKAGVMDPQGRLWIAKFPSRNDGDLDQGAWEHLAHQLARRSGVVTSDADARRYNSTHHTFLTKRFDRVGNGERIHFASAMTLLGRDDGDDASAGASYLEMAELLMRQGAHADRDMEQLWRRIVFFICISNVDDHLRNHGFLLHPDGWSLSPAYDMNPAPDSDGLKLNISDVDNAQDLELAQEVAAYFRVKPTQSREIIAEVTAAVKEWRDVAQSLGIASRERDRMERAFRVAESAS